LGELHKHEGVEILLLPPPANNANPTIPPDGGPWQVVYPPALLLIPLPVISTRSSLPIVGRLPAELSELPERWGSVVTVGGG